MLNTVKHVHFVAIGGIGMSALARILNGWGVKVSGSDVVDSVMTRELAGLGVTVYQGHDVANLAVDVDLLVYCSVFNQYIPD